MKKQKYYEKYPYWIIIISNVFSIAIYLIGAFIIYQLGSIWLVSYLLYILWIEIRILRRSCVNCYYYGKYCAFGKGKISYLLFKKGDSKKFIQDKITWKDIIPDFMVSVIPMLVGIAILIIDFNWFLLTMIVILALLTFTGNALVRGSLACKYCKQREIGCPAEQLFNKTKT